MKVIKNEAGFSLMELMIVVAIIGILATIAFPRFQAFQLRAMQSEAKSNLGSIGTLMEAYAINHPTNSYSGAVLNAYGKPVAALTTAAQLCPTGANNTIGFSINGCSTTAGAGPTIRYQYTLPAPATPFNTFTATATSGIDGNHGLKPGCGTADVQTLNQAGVHAFTTNAATSCN
jgi:prepilin-type N-terminal cleavage/methylation domain-containing protein